MCHSLPMSSARFLTRAVLPIAQVLTLAAALFLSLRAADDRDEAAFAGYVTRSTPGDFATVVSGADPHQWEYDWAAAHPEVVLSEGDASCRWLSGRADPSDADASAAFSVDALVSAHVREAEQPGLADFSDLGKRNVVYGAWAYLCPSTRADKAVSKDDEED